jgi:heterotetrameric sarcosine oxidase gamma subunit
VTLDFLSPGAIAFDGGETPVARSPMEVKTRAAGARFELRDGWNVAVGYGSTVEQEAAVAAETAGWADVSHLGKLELQAPAAELSAIASGFGAELAFGEAARVDEAWWCRLTSTRALVVCQTTTLAPLRERLVQAASAAEHAGVVDVTSNFAALTLTGPIAREVFARFSAIDLRPAKLPVRGLRPGSIARQPGILICEADDRYLFMFGWATGEYMWEVVDDAGRHLGGRPIGVDALPALSAIDPTDPTHPPAEEAARA